MLELAFSTKGAAALLPEKDANFLTFHLSFRGVGFARGSQGRVQGRRTIGGFEGWRGHFTGV